MKILEWLPRESACDYALRVILHNIIHLELMPGCEISSSKLAAALSLSRMPVRDALAELSRIELVEIFPQRGTYVSKIDIELVKESRFMRLVLEVAVSKLACQGITQSCKEAMQKNLDEYRENYLNGMDIDRALELDNEFHRLIFAGVNKLWTYQKLREQMVHFDRLRMLSMSSIADKAEDTLRDHEDILYAINRQDAEMAEMLVTRHLSHYEVDIEDIKKENPDYFVAQKEKNISD